MRSAGEWESLFARSDGWTGGDGLATVALPGHRVLWLFGDSWIGPVRDGRHAAGSALVNNAIAVQAIPPAGVRPAPEHVTFCWGPNDAAGKPTAWMVPPAEERARDRNLRYWPAGGGLVISDTHGPPTLYVFMARVRDSGASNSVWNFEGCGSAVARIENPQDAPGAWRITQTTLTRLPAPVPPSARRVQWGAAAWRDDDTARSPAVFVFGVDATDGWNKKLLLARASAESPDRFETWSFRTEAGWSNDPAAAAPVADNVMDEFSISRVDVAGVRQLLMIYSKPILDDHIVARLARRPEGPWTPPHDVYRCPEPASDKRLFAYSAKAHLELSSPGDLLISYCVNSNDFWHMAANAWIYRPRFIRAPLAAVVDRDAP